MSDLSSRRRLLRGAVAVAAASALPTFSIAQGSSQQVLRLGYIGPGKKPANATGWALRQGHLLRELAPLGFKEVTTRNFPNGPDLNEAFLSGALDVGIYGDTPAVVARSRGLEGQLIGFDAVGSSSSLSARATRRLTRRSRSCCCSAARSAGSQSRNSFSRESQRGCTRRWAWRPVTRGSRRICWRRCETSGPTG